MKNPWILVIGLMVASPSMGQVFRPIPDFAPSSIPFDVGGGRVEAWSRYLPCEANTATFKAIIKQGHLDKDWSSMVRVSLSNSPTMDRKFETYDPQSFDEAVFVTLVSNQSEVAKSLAVIEARKKGDGTRFPFSLFPISIQNNREYVVSLGWGPEGHVTASINGGAKLAMKMGKRVTTLSLHISGAKAEIRDLRIGRIGPPPTGKEVCTIS